MTVPLKFIHVMKEASYLEQALEEGLMFTDHRVAFDSSSSSARTAQILHSYTLPLLQKRVAALGLGGRALNLNALTGTLGSMAGKVPMICFSEIQRGRELGSHFVNFGAYGVAVNREWLERQGGDRVVYAGPNSAITERLHRLFIDHQIACIYDDAGTPLYDSRSLAPILDLLVYVQGRDQLEEVEWRIAGHHGFMGGPRSTDTRIPLPLADIETVLVQRESDKPKFKSILKSLAKAQGLAKTPRILVQPKTLPFPRTRY
jgi:hypothetical protein